MSHEDEVEKLLQALTKGSLRPDDLFKRQLFEQLRKRARAQAIPDPFLVKVAGTKRYEWLRFRLKFNPLAMLVPFSTMIAILLRLIFSSELAVWVAWLVGGVR